MLRTIHALPAALLAATLLISCSEPEADPEPGVEVINNTTERFYIQETAGEVAVASGRSHRSFCSDGACPTLTLRSPICTYSFDLTPLYAHDASMQTRVMPVQIEPDFTLYTLPHGAHRPARVPPREPEARLRPDSVDCPS